MNSPETSRVYAVKVIVGNDLSCTGYATQYSDRDAFVKGCGVLSVEFCATFDDAIDFFKEKMGGVAVVEGDFAAGHCLARLEASVSALAGLVADIGQEVAE